MAKKDEEKVEVEGAPAVETMDGPLLDLNDAAVKRMIKLAKKRGFVTYSELNAVLPSEEVSSDQIEDVYSMLSEMGITVSEGDNEDQEEEGQEQEADEPEGGELVEAPRATAVATKTSEPADRTDDPSACICARWARWSSCRARARSPSPSASRPGARR